MEFHVVGDGKSVEIRMRVVWCSARAFLRALLALLFFAVSLLSMYAAQLRLFE